MALNNYQLITRVLPGQPFGSGKDGALTISADTNQSVANAGCSISAGSPTLTLDTASTFANGDLVLIVQQRGTGVGAWEINRVISGGGTTTLTLQVNSQNTYTDSGDSQAQVYEIKEYSNVNVNSTKTLFPNQAWDGNRGGILAFAANGVLTVDGTISIVGYGFRGGQSAGSGCQKGYSGEGSINGYNQQTTTHHGTGAGGGWNADGATSGEQAGDVVPGSGGYAFAGSIGGGQFIAGEAGDSIGDSELTQLHFGGAGGSGGINGGGGSGSGVGGNGTGILACFVKNIIVNGLINTNGGAGGNTGNSNASGGSGGAGGSAILICGIAILGSSLLTSSGGAGGSGGANGTIGSVGRIAVHYSSNVSGTTTPTFTQVFDGRLVETSGGIAFFI